MNLTRRALLAAGTAVLAGCDQKIAPETRSALPLTPAAAAAPSRAASSPATAPTGNSTALRAVLTRYLKPTEDNPRHPSYAGAVALVLRDGRTRLTTTVGDALRYTAGPVELPPSKRVAMRPDSIFDLASLTKVFTAVLTLQLVARGKLALDAPVQRYLPGFTGAGKDKVTVAMLLAHTGALPVGPAKATWQSVLTTPLVKGGVPGKAFRYSSTGFLVLGLIVEKLTGTTLDKALRAGITNPLGLTDTGFRPLTWVRDKQRLAATDARSSRGLLRGTVHDDVANHLGGVAGHAGVFSTARDVAALGQALLDGKLLPASLMKQMLTNVNKGKPAIDPDRPHRTADHGLGVELNQPWFMGRLASPTAYGHTGFTGTSLLVVPARREVIVLLANRAHPNWSWSNPDLYRVAAHNTL